MKNRTLIYNTSEVVTCHGFNGKTKKDMQNVEVKPHYAIYIEDGMIVDLGPEELLIKKYQSLSPLMIDALNHSVIPGFIDPHTHLVFAGYREKEFQMRMNNYTYLDIMKLGGGINNTVIPTREASFNDLYLQSKKYIDSMITYGVTTIEAKSGYGLDLETEIKVLEVQKKLNEEEKIDIVSTYLGAHAIPVEYQNSDDYVDYMINVVMPIVKEKELATFVDIFVEKQVFTLEQGEKIIQKAKSLGFKTKMHVDELSPLHGAGLAADLKVDSADHLLYASDDDIKKLANRQVPCVLLPLTAFNLKTPYAKARQMIDEGCIVALGTDFNPGSCFSENLALVFLLANLYMDMSTEEILNAMTINAATSLGLADKIGSIDIGKQADLVILDYPSYQFIPYHLGVSSVNTVIKKGEIIYQRG